MAIRITRQVSFGTHTRAFRFEVFRDEAQDKKIYELGCELEKERFREGSLGQKIYERIKGADNASLNTHNTKNA